MYLNLIIFSSIFRGPRWFYCWAPGVSGWIHMPASPHGKCSSRTWPQVHHHQWRLQSVPYFEVYRVFHEPGLWRYDRPWWFCSVDYKSLDQVHFRIQLSIDIFVLSFKINDKMRFISRALNCVKNKVSFVSFQPWLFLLLSFHTKPYLQHRVGDHQRTTRPSIYSCLSVRTATN